MEGLVSGRFRIRTVDRETGQWPGWRWFIVRVYPDQPSLARAANRATPWVSHDEADACLQPSIDRYADDDGKPGKYLGGPRSGYGGIVRIHRSRLSAEVVAHEAVHVALRVFRWDHAEDVRLGKECRRREEDLAYLVGDATQAINDLLFRLDVYPGVWHHETAVDKPL